MQIRERGREIPAPSKRALERLDELEHEMDARGAEVSPEVRNYVHATLSYGVEKTRSEYRPIGKRNWHAIQVWGRRLTILAVVFLLAQIPIALLTAKNLTDIQNGRRDRILHSCESGERFARKLHADIAALPLTAERERAKATEAETVELIETITPMHIRPGLLQQAKLPKRPFAHCQDLLRDAGL